MQALRSKRFKMIALAGFFAAGIGFGVAQADSPYSEGCPPKAGCQYGGGKVGCCVIE